MDMNQCVEHALVISLTRKKENKEKYTQRDACKTQLAQKLKAVTGISAHDPFIAVRSHIKNCTVVVAHAKMAEKGLGHSITGVQGKKV